MLVPAVGTRTGTLSNAAEDGGGDEDRDQGEDGAGVVEKELRWSRSTDV